MINKEDINGQNHYNLTKYTQQYLAVVIMYVFNSNQGLIKKTPNMLPKPTSKLTYAKKQPICVSNVKISLHGNMKFT